MVLPAMLLGNPVNGLATRSVRVAMNKVKCPIFCTCVSRMTYYSVVSATTWYAWILSIGIGLVLSVDGKFEFCLDFNYNFTPISS